jgi:cysteinyl-tRNA synthetase
MPIRFYNTLSQQLEVFTPLHDNKVHMYTCGPTVYNFVHIGNLRTFTFQDILRRWLLYRGYVLDHVMNITDVEDKIIAGAARLNKTLAEYTAPYEQAFFEDCALMRLQRPERIVKATDHVHEMAEAVEALTRKGCTYVSEGSTYFRIKSFAEYGKLSHNNFDGIISGARVDVDEYDKADARDFVLWKARKDVEPFWHEPIGDGRPGWHIECSVMAMKYLGETLDIHAGGVDLIFPHHENEIAQSESLSGKPFSRYWLHSEHLLIESQKMSKSLGNFYTLRDLVNYGHSPESVRFLLASVPYRKKLNFTFDGLKAAATSIERLRNFADRMRTAKLPNSLSSARVEELAARFRKAKADFESSLDDDLNTAEALAAIFEFVREINTALDQDQFPEASRAGALELLGTFDSVFDVLRPNDMVPGLRIDLLPQPKYTATLGEGEIERLIEARTAAKKARDFARADEIRSELLEKGIVLEDTKDGVRWKLR